MAKRKAILALIDGAVYVDPADAKPETFEKIEKQFGKEVKVIIAPIQMWMPESGVRALIKEIKKDLGISKENESKRNKTRRAKKIPLF